MCSTFKNLDELEFENNSNIELIKLAKYKKKLENVENILNNTF